MAPIGTLYTTPQQWTGKVIRSVAALTGQEVELPKDYVHFHSNKQPEFLAKFPHGKIPAFESTSGFKVFESQGVARYVASLSTTPNLLGNTKEEAALVDQWISFATGEIHHHLYILRGMFSHQVPYNKVFDTHCRDQLTRALTTLDGFLLKNTFAVGHRISLADLFLAGALQTAFITVLDTPTSEKLPNLRRYFETVTNQKGLAAIYGETKYLEKSLQYTPPKKEEKPKPAKEEKPATHKQEQKPKKKEVEEDEEEEDDVPKEVKAKNPLDDLPKSNFNLEDWKRAYSNMETRGAGGSLEWFYEKFDTEGFSVWRIDFKYNSELTLVFMSSNQIGGFFNRLEGSRKYLFGSVGVLGEVNNSVISGVLILRGKDFKGVVDVAPDWESYTYKELKVVGAGANAEDKKFFEAALAWDLEVDGKKWADGKNFK